MTLRWLNQSAICLAALCAAMGCQSVVKVTMHEPTVAGFIATRHTNFGVARASASNFCARDGREFWLNDPVLTEANEVCGNVSGKAGAVCVPMVGIRYFISKHDETVYGISDEPLSQKAPDCRAMADVGK